MAPYIYEKERRFLFRDIQRGVVGMDDEGLGKGVTIFRTVEKVEK